MTGSTWADLKEKLHAAAVKSCITELAAKIRQSWIKRGRRNYERVAIAVLMQEVAELKARMK